ncbi:IS200/IS605 family transposase [Methanoculleus bourgensis]|jgi:putative transposase|uniref:IS200/IS605 family transposase n=1 Tax=Methanoculleus bourgensis TaxID=83986 RepID=UPI003B950B22
MKYKLDRSAHSVFALSYHLVIVVKYRRKALYSHEIRERLKDIVWDLSDDLGIEVVAHEPADDHYHLLFKATPKTNLVNAVNVIKGVSSRRLRQEFPATKDLLWGNSFWSPSYFLATSGQVSLGALKEYVDSQEERIE